MFLVSAKLYPKATKKLVISGKTLNMTQQRTLLVLLLYFFSGYNFYQYRCEQKRKINFELLLAFCGYACQLKQSKGGNANYCVSPQIPNPLIEMYLRIRGIFKSSKNWVRKSQIGKSQKYMVRKSQIRQLPHLQKVRKFMKKIRSAKLRICHWRNSFADRPPLWNTKSKAKAVRLLNCEYMGLFVCVSWKKAGVGVKLCTCETVMYTIERRPDTLKVSLI